MVFRFTLQVLLKILKSILAFFVFKYFINSFTSFLLLTDSSLADLYDELTMPQELRKAHQQNDIAVMNAYGFSVKEMSESDCVAELMKMYQNLLNKRN